MFTPCASISTVYIYIQKIFDFMLRPMLRPIVFFPKVSQLHKAIKRNYNKRLCPRLHDQTMVWYKLMI